MKDGLRSAGIRGTAAAAFATCVFAFIGNAQADEAGISFWLPGLYGSLAALPGQPGWSFQSFYMHT